MPTRDSRAAPDEHPDARGSLFDMTLFASSPIGVAHVALDGRWLDVNPALCSMLGYSAEELTGGLTVYDVTHDEDIDASIDRLQGMVETLEGYQLDKRYIARDGRVLDVRISVSPLRDDSGELVGTVGHVQDRTAEIAAQRSRESTALLYERILRFSNDVILILDEDGNHRYVSPNITDLLGRPLDRYTGKPFGSYIHPDDISAVEQRFAVLVQSGGTASATYRILHSDGRWRWIEATCVDRRDDPHVSGIICNLRDVTDRLDYEDALHHQANHDALTGLPNRTLLIDRLTTAIGRADRGQSTFAVLFCDLDHFKRINDTLGHDVGDLVLLGVANRLQERLRFTDTLARIGGDEFVILVEGFDQHDDLMTRVRALAGELLEVLNRPLEIRNHKVVATASIGIAVHEPGLDVRDMLRNADVAMYVAKEQGRSRFAVHDEAMRARAVERFRMDSVVRSALDHGGIAIELQPIFDLASGEAVGAEALVRLEVDGVRYPPMAFLAAAEESGAISQIGEEVLMAALEAIAEWPENTFVSVNVSAQQLAGLDRLVLDALDVTGIEASRLVLEVTETTLVESSEQLLHSTNRLAEAGVRIALDDFGTGWSSLSYLRMFPVSIVKIDRSFVDGVARIGSGDIEVIRAVLGLAAALDIDVIAEGIENRIQATVLAQLGCPYGQGYLYARPEPVGEHDEQLVEYIPLEASPAPRPLSLNG